MQEAVMLRKYLLRLGSGGYRISTFRNCWRSPRFEALQLQLIFLSSLKMDAKLITPQGEREVHETWVLDGQDREAAPAGGAPGAKVKKKGWWLPDNRRFVLMEETTAETPKGPSTQTVTRKYSLSADGGTLTVDYYIDRPQGSGESKRVFIRQP